MDWFGRGSDSSMDWFEHGSDSSMDWFWHGSDSSMEWFRHGSDSSMDRFWRGSDSSMNWFGCGSDSSTDWFGCGSHSSMDWFGSGSNSSIEWFGYNICRLHSCPLVVSAVRQLISQSFNPRSPVSSVLTTHFHHDSFSLHLFLCPSFPLLKATFRILRLWSCGSLVICSARPA